MLHLYYISIYYITPYFKVAQSNVFSSSMSDAAAAAPASIGRGNPSSLACRRDLTQRLSIVDRLAGRSVAGRGLQILVHQHHGIHLHLEWSGGSSGRLWKWSGGSGGRLYSSRFMKRQFVVSGRVKISCTELCSRGLGLCTCVYDTCNMFPHDRAPRCFHYHLISIYRNRSDDDD